jgi:hypothetical protein
MGSSYTGIATLSHLCRSTQMSSPATPRLASSALVGSVHRRPEQFGLQQLGEPCLVLRGCPAELDAQQVVELGAGEGAVPLACLGDRQSRSERRAEELADPLGLDGQPMSAQLRGGHPVVQSDRRTCVEPGYPDESGMPAERAVLLRHDDRLSEGRSALDQAGHELVSRNRFRHR